MNFTIATTINKKIRIPEGMNNFSQIKVLLLSFRDHSHNLQLPIPHGTKSAESATLNYDQDPKSSKAVPLFVRRNSGTSKP